MQIQKILFGFLSILLLVSVVSAGIFDWLKGIGITGKLTEQSVAINISVGAGNAPLIYNVYNSSISVATGPTEGPGMTNIVFNFSVSDADGSTNLNDSSAIGNVSRGGQITRTNLSCSKITSSGIYANYTCNITMWWFDGAGVWNISAQIRDVNGNSAQNLTKGFYLGTTTGFKGGPATLQWSAINPGTYNNTATTSYKLNNTGNVEVTTNNTQVNATNLYGETDNSMALYAGNFSVGNKTGTNAECDVTTSTPMMRSAFIHINNSLLLIGNYTKDDGTAQEELYFCLRYAGSELITQPYSTFQDKAWTVKIIA